MELTSRFLDRLRLIELITALCILASLSVVLSAYEGDGTPSSTPAIAKYATSADFTMTAKTSVLRDHGGVNDR